MTQQVHILDAPFRSGTSGKYKLLIQGVSHNVDGYVYALVDAEGKEYLSIHPKHYAPEQILRCMVHFKVANATLIVTETLICSKQDFATALPDLPKPKQQKKQESDPMVSTVRGKLGDPIKSRVSGVYRLLVVEVDRGEKKCIYTLEDAIGRKYKAKSKRYYKAGSIIGCQVNTVLTTGGVKAAVASMGKRPKSPKGHHGHHGHAGRNSRDWLPAPPVGTHFHLIYTPMGNKR